MASSAHATAGSRCAHCAQPLAGDSSQHLSLTATCPRCGMPQSVASLQRRRPARGGWVGERVMAVVIGSGVLVLGAAYLLLATERSRLLGASLFSLPAFVGAACLLGGGLLLARSVRG